MSSLVRRNLSVLLPRLVRGRHSSLSLSPHHRLHLLQTAQRTQRVGVHSRAQASIRLQEDQEQPTGSAVLQGKSSKLEEKLARFLERLDSGLKANQRVLKYEVGNSIVIIQALNSCTANQALFLIKCHGEVCLFIISLRL